MWDQYDSPRHAVGWAPSPLAQFRNCAIPRKKHSKFKDRFSWWNCFRKQIFVHATQVKSFFTRIMGTPELPVGKKTPYQGRNRCQGSFKCDFGHRWNSHHSWANYGQKCMKCIKERQPKKGGIISKGDARGVAFTYPWNQVRFLDAFSHLYTRVCPSVRPSVRHTRVETMQKCRFWPKELSVPARMHLMAVYPALLLE